MATRTLIPQTTLAAAGTITGDWIKAGNIESLAVWSKFVRAAGGTTAKVYVQTSFDGGTTAVDVAQHAFATTTATKISAVSSHIAPAAQAYAPASAALTDDTIAQGVLGDLIRAICVSVGTYTGASHITVVAVTK